MPLKSPGEKDVFTELRVKFVILQNHCFRVISHVVILCQWVQGVALKLKPFYVLPEGLTGPGWGESSAGPSYVMLCHLMYRTSCPSFAFLFTAFPLLQCAPSCIVDWLTAH